MTSSSDCGGAATARIDALEDDLCVEEKENAELEEDLRALLVKQEAVLDGLRRARSGHMHWQ